MNKRDRDRTRKTLPPTGFIILRSITLIIGRAHTSGILKEVSRWKARTLPCESALRSIAFYNSNATVQVQILTVCNL